jgi:hypothetical protein
MTSVILMITKHLSHFDTTTMSKKWDIEQYSNGKKWCYSILLASTIFQITQWTESIINYSNIVKSFGSYLSGFEHTSQFINPAWPSHRQYIPLFLWSPMDTGSHFINVYTKKKLAPVSQATDNIIVLTRWHNAMFAGASYCVKLPLNASWSGPNSERSRSFDHLKLFSSHVVIRC